MKIWAWLYLLAGLYCLLYWPLLAISADFEEYLDWGFIIATGMTSLMVLPVFLLSWLHPRVRSTTYFHLGKWPGNTFVICIGMFLIFGWFLMIQLSTTDL